MHFSLSNIQNQSQTDRERITSTNKYNELYIPCEQVQLHFFRQIGKLPNESILIVKLQLLKEL